MNNTPLLVLGTTEFFSPKGYIVDEGYLSTLVTFTRASVGKYYDSLGVLRESPPGIVRVNYPQDGGTDFGLFIEAAATNVCLQSEDIATTWTNLNSSEEVNTYVAPDAVSTGDKIIVDMANAAHGIEQTYTGSTSNDFCGSVFVRQDTHTDMYLRLSDTTDTDYIDIIVDLSNGSILQAATATGVNATVTAGGVETLINGWYRVWISGICDSTTTSHKIVVGVSQGTTISYTGNGTDSIFTWGMQLEENPFPTSYITTTTVSVTRAADVVTLDLTSVSWFSATEGSLYVDFKRDINVDGLTTHVVDLNDTTANEVIKISQGSTTASNITGDIDDGGVSQFSVTVNDATVNTRKKVAMAWKLNDSAIAVDGSTPTTDSSCTLPTVTDLQIGAGVSATNTFYGIVRGLIYYDTRLANSTLTTLTT
jgi:hypothetical protein